MVAVTVPTYMHTVTKMVTIDLMDGTRLICRSLSLLFIVTNEFSSVEHA